MSQVIALGRLWATRLLWLLVAGTLTVLIAFVPEGLVYEEDRRTVIYVDPPPPRQPGDLYRIEPWEQLSGYERPWHWSWSAYADAVKIYGKQLLAGNPQYAYDTGGIFRKEYRPIMPEIKRTWPKSALIFGISLVGGVLLGIIVGSLAIGRRLVRNLSVGVSVGFMAIPDFYVILLGQFATILTYSTWGFRLWTVGVPGGERHWVLPIVALSILPIGYTARLMGGALDEIMAQDYIRTARSKGIPERRVIFGHAFRNALPQVLNGLPVMINATLSSLVIVELLTSWNGLGRLLQPPPDEVVRMVTARLMATAIPGQPPMLATVGLIFCVWFVVLNGLAHSLRLLVNPRLREVEK